MLPVYSHFMTNKQKQKGLLTMDGIMHDQRNFTPPEKIKPKTKIQKNHDEDGRHEWDEVVYFCPVCDRTIGIKYGDPIACDKCGCFYDWGTREPKMVVKKYLDW